MFFARSLHSFTILAVAHLENHFWVAAGVNVPLPLPSSGYGVARTVIYFFLALP
ncbi:MAG: hypothetical protein ACHQT8_04130 [Chlamydiales bacterium]